MRRRISALLPVLFFALAATCFPSTSRGASMVLSPSPLQWLQATPVIAPAIGPVKTLSVDFFAKADGNLVLVPPVLTSGTTTLPANRIWFQNKSGDYVPLSAGGTTVDSLPARDRNYIIPINLAAMVQASDPPGTYQGTMTVRFDCSKPSQSEYKTVNIIIEIVPWAQVTYEPAPVQVTSPTGNPGDDLTGQSQITVHCNGQWSLDICAPADFISPSSSFPSNQAQFSQNAGGPWVVLGPSWTPLRTGNGSTQFVLYLKVMQPFNKRSGVYTSPLSLRINTL